MKASTLREKSLAELQAQLEEVLKERFNLRMKAASDQLKTHHHLKEARRNIARIKTLIHEKQQLKGE